MFFLGVFGIYQHFDNGMILLFSRNPLPAGALLILLSTSTIILLNRNLSSALKLLLTLTLIISGVLIFLTTKKSHILGISIILLFFVFRNRKNLIYFLSFTILSGCLLYFTNPLFSNKKDAAHSNSSIILRAENYFFGFHILKSTPIWGLGFQANLDHHLKDYQIKLSNQLSKKNYQTFLKSLNTFENIVLTYLIEWGSLFSFAYFGGLLYLVAGSARRICTPTSENTAGLLLVAVIIGFSIMSLTFDTLRFPNLNWMFHSLLGLMVNLSNASPLTTSLKTS
jgi:hypothetical protein